jgi:hypothetical protein
MIYTETGTYKAIFLDYIAYFQWRMVIGVYKMNFLGLRTYFLWKTIDRAYK